MDALRPPTDNLYKFLAVSGVVLVLAGLTLLGLAVDRAAEAGLAANDELRQLHAAVTGNAAATRAVEDAMRRVVAGKSDASLPGRLRGAGADDAAVARAVAMQRATDLFLYRKSVMNLAASPGGATLGVGAAASLLGFTFWFTRVQQYEDAILRRRARDEAETGDSRSKPTTSFQSPGPTPTRSASTYGRHRR